MLQEVLVRSVGYEQARYVKRRAVIYKRTITVTITTWTNRADPFGCIANHVVKSPTIRLLLPDRVGQGTRISAIPRDRRQHRIGTAGVLRSSGDVAAIE